MKKLTVTIRDDQKEWLDKTPLVNVSGLLQMSIDSMKEVLETLDMAFTDIKDD